MRERIKHDAKRLRCTRNFWASLLGSAALLACVAGRPTRALACSCVAPTLSRQVVPANGAIEFPLDGIVRVFLPDFPDSLRDDVAREYRLRDATGSLVVIDVVVAGPRLDIRARAPLAPNAHYVLEQVFAFDELGTRMSDMQRLLYRGVARGVWYGVAEFQTGTSSAPERHVDISLASANMSFAYGGGDCGPCAALRAALGDTRDLAPTDVAELRIRSLGVADSGLASSRLSLYANDCGCNSRPITLPRDASVDAQIVVLDVAGRVLGETPWRSVTGTGPRPEGGQTQDDVHWPATRIIPPPATGTPAGPGSCPFGVVAEPRAAVVGEGAPWAYEDRTLIASGRDRRWLAYPGGSGDGALRLYSVADNGTTTRVPTPLRGRPVATLATLVGPLLSISHHEREQGAVMRGGQVALLRNDGHAFWTTQLPNRSQAIGLAEGNGQILALVETLDSGYARRFSLALLNAENGTLLESSPLPSTVRRASIAYVDGRFMVAVSTTDRSRTASIAIWMFDGHRFGQSVTHVPVGGSESFELVAAGTRAALVSDSMDGTILLSVLDRDGALVVSPTRVSRGVGGSENRLPHAAWNGSSLAVAWEAYPSGGVYVAVADAAGLVSPATRLDPDGSRSGTVGIAPTQTGWIAGYTVDREVGQAARLSCATEAPNRAPQSIGALEAGRQR